MASTSAAAILQLSRFVCRAVPPCEKEESHTDWLFFKVVACDFFGLVPVFFWVIVYFLFLIGQSKLSVGSFTNYANCKSGGARILCRNHQRDSSMP